MNKFDPYAAIKELAEAEWECHSGLEHNYGTCAAGCKDGRIVLFPALRVLITPKMLLLWNIKVTMEDARRGWVPEPDIRAACWEISSNLEIMSNVTFNPSVQKWQWYDREGLPSHRGWTSVDRREEAVLCAALARVKA